MHLPVALLDPGAILVGVALLWWRMAQVEKRLDRIERKLNG